MKRKPTKREIWDELRQRRRVGALLSNCAFNLSQQKQLSERDCKSLKDVQKEWDAINYV